MSDVRHVPAGVLKARKRVLDPLELELWAVSHLMWVLGTQSRSYGRAIFPLNCRALTPALIIKFYWTTALYIC